MPAVSPAHPSLSSAERHHRASRAEGALVALVVEHMARETEEAADDHRQALFEQELQNFAETVMGVGYASSSRWSNLT